MYILVKDRVPTRNLGFGSAMEKWVEGQNKKGFSSFFAIFDEIFHSGACLKCSETLKNHRI